MASAIEPHYSTNGRLNRAAVSKPLVTTLQTSSIDESLLSPRDAHSDSNLGSQTDEASTTSPVTSPSSIMSPPYWMNSYGHQRSVSNMSTESVLLAGAITMRDNETDVRNDRNNACWAKSVQITDYVIVNSSATNIGAFVVWNIRVETLNVSRLGSRQLPVKTGLQGPSDFTFGS